MGSVSKTTSLRSGIVLFGVITIFAAIACRIALAGALGGPKGTNEIVLARDTDTYRVVFKAGESASATVVGDGDIDLYVYDENGNLIGSDCRGSYTATLTWNPRWTGLFTLRVFNCEHKAVNYRIDTN